MVHPSQNWDARYGWELLAEHGHKFDSYIAVTSPSAWEAVRRFFTTDPSLLEFQKGMGEADLDELLPRVPTSDFVLGIGGGNALDVARYVAWKTDTPLVAIPTIVSTGSVFQTALAIRGSETWEFIREDVSPEYLLFDFGVIRSAPPRLNCAGMAECISHLGVVESWRAWVDERLDGPAWDQVIADTTLTWVRDRAAAFSSDRDADGQPGEAGIRVAAEINRERYGLLSHQGDVGHSLDHVFVIAFEHVLGRQLIHGEGVGLGAAINCYLYGSGFDETKALLDSCGVRYRPHDIGCTQDEVRTVLDRINELNDKLGHPKNWFHYHRLSDATFRRMMRAVDA